MLPLLLFHKFFHLLQFIFSCASTNRYFKAIIGAPSTSFKFSMSFYKLRLHYLRCVFHVSISGVFLCLEVFASFKGVSIIHHWGSGDEAISGFLGYSQVYSNPIRSRKASWFGVLRVGHLWVIKPLKGDFFNLFRVLTPSLL